MDNKKIGKLIADLRKKKGLTQQDLGDMVGVGFRAVSKWECGMTLPDITIINELSKILGISLDELMSGEINVETENKAKKKISSRIKKILIVCVLAIMILISFLIYYNNKTYTYDIVSEEKSDYYVEGKVNFNKDKISIIVNEIRFKNLKFSDTTIINYEYEIKVNEKFIFGYGYMETINNLDKSTTIKEFAKSFNIKYETRTKIRREEIVKNNLTLKFNFMTVDKKEITKEIKLLLA